MDSHEEGKEKSSEPPMEWTPEHDITLCRELLLVNPFKEKYKTTKRAKLWDEARASLIKSVTPSFKKSLEKRAVQERYRHLADKFKKKMANGRKESGISPTMSELDTSVEELVEREQSEKDQRDNEDKSMKNKRREEGEKMRLKALERLGETSKRKKEKEDGKWQKKSRRSGGDTIQYIREKSEQEVKLREKDQKLEKSKQEEEKRKNDAFLNAMLQQQQQQEQQQQQLMALLAQQNQLMMKMFEKNGK